MKNWNDKGKNYEKEMLTRIYYWFEGTSLNLFYWLNVMSKNQTIIKLFTSIQSFNFRQGKIERNEKQHWNYVGILL
jgi:hypothetical protein